MAEESVAEETTTVPDPPTSGFEVPALEKAATGIVGFDELTHGGLPRGRPTLVAGDAGSGKTLFGLEFLVRGASQFGEPGVLVSLEESHDDLCANVASLGLDLAGLERDGKLLIDAFRLDPNDFIEAGEFDLEGLFLRLATAVDAVGARRVVLDTLETLFTTLGNEAIVRAELIRLFRWLKARDLTTVITGERGRGGQLTRFGIEEYVSDCVMVLDNRVVEEISTRRLRVIKYRGSTHGTNEYPFIISNRGLEVAPITSVTLNYPASRERVTTGIDRLDHLLAGGVYRGTTVLVSGSAGTGKTTIGAHAAAAACRRGERALFVSFEESPDQLVRNMASVGIDLQPWVDAGLLWLWAVRPTVFGLEEHLAELHRLLDEISPTLVVLDALGSLSAVGGARATTATVARDNDLLKSRGITTVMTSLTHGPEVESPKMAVSSLVDTWLLLRNVESDGERNRLLFVIKSRGMAHSNQVREFVITDRGAELVDVSVGPRGVLTGEARLAQVAQERAAATARAAEVARRRQALARHATEIQTQIAALREQLESQTAELEQFVAADAAAQALAETGLEESARHRADEPPEVVD